MEINLFIDKLFENANASGLLEFEAYYSEGESFSFKIYNGQIDDYKNSLGKGLSFRAIYNGRMGYSFTENFDESSIPLLIKELIGNASVLETSDKEFIYEGAKEYDKRENFKGLLDNYDASYKIDQLILLEKLAKEYDKRVHSVNYCMYGEGVGKRVIRNSKGLHLENKDDGAHVYLSVVLKEGDETKTGYSLKYFSNFSEFSPEECAKEAVERALSLLGSKSLKSGKYDIIIKNEAFVDLMDAMGGIFSAEAVDKGLSKFKDRISQKVSSEKISIIDNPLMENGIFKTFDDEGVPTKEKYLIKNGILETYLHSLKTANKFNVTPTGNGQKASYKSSVIVGTYNFYIESGDKSFDSLVKDLNNGIILIEFDGLHAGLNSISGDFSLSTRGYKVENGKITNAVNEITLAGNYFDLLLNCEELSNDLKFSYPFGKAGSPSLLFRNLDVSGE